MYTRVKRDRPKIKRDMYGVSIHDEDDMNTGDSSEGVTGGRSTINQSSQVYLVTHNYMIHFIISDATEGIL